MPRMLSLAAVAVLSLNTMQAAAQFRPEEVRAAQKDPRQFTIDEKTITFENLGPTVSPSEIPPPQTDPGGDPFPVLDQIINMGKKIWAIIEANKPVVNINTTYATALPEGIKSWNQLSGWKPPKGTVYGFYAKNAYGATMINVKYQVLRTYGGGYKGKGKYLTAVTIEPLLVEVGWGYKFDLTAQVPDTSVVNVGTSEDPVAAMMPTLKWRISTAIKDASGQSIYYLQGDGLFQEMGGPFKKGLEDDVATALQGTIPL
ncbi:MAG: hypothetical protein AAB320_02965 [Elusimicrobiota bacterium]